jgi:hypothetical protein
MSNESSDFAFLFPILHSRNRVPDLEALRTWYEAVSDALQFEVPHDLFALWAFAHSGEPTLIAPEELAADSLQVPQPHPFVDPHALARIEDRVQSARYASVICRPIRHGSSDVGVLLIAAFRPELYGIREHAVVESATEAMAPMLARYSRGGHASEVILEPPAAPPEATEPSEEPSLEAPAEEAGEIAQPPRASGPATRSGAAEHSEAADLNALYRAVAEATAGAGTPRDFMLALSFAMQPLLPHDGSICWCRVVQRTSTTGLACTAMGRSGPILDWRSDPRTFLRADCSAVLPRP